MTTGATTADIVIVGGGIYGTSLAFELGSRGYSVMLLEAHDIASGASGGPGERGVRANGRDIRELPVISQALERWQKFESEIEGGVGYRRVGHLQVFDVPYGYREHEIRGRMEAQAAIQTQLGTPTNVLDRDEVLEKEPEMTRSIIGGLYCPNDGVGDHTFATRQFAAAAERTGVAIRTKARAVEIIKQGSTAKAVRLESGEVITVGSKLFLLCNAGVPTLLSPILSRHEIPYVWNLMPQMMYVTNPESKKIKHLLSHAHRRLAIKQLPDGTVMLSGGVSVTHEGGKVAQGSLSSTAINLTDAISTLPFLDRSEFLKVDATRVETVALDAIPMIGQPEAAENVYFGYAWSGHGFAISLGFTKLFADWVESGRKPIELEPFSPTRFTLTSSAPRSSELQAMALSA
jgi:sarcosine oxidase, subunit beta